MSQDRPCEWPRPELPAQEAWGSLGWPPQLPSHLCLSLPLKPSSPLLEVSLSPVDFAPEEAVGLVAQAQQAEQVSKGRRDEADP